MSELLDRVREHQSSGRALLFRMMGALDPEVSALGSWVTTASGRRFLDLGSFAVFLLGHGRPEVVDAVAHQLRTMAGATRTLPNPVTAAAADALAGIAPPGMDKVMLLNSGAEAVEAAIKLTRVHTGRPGVAHLANSFHGKTLGALSLTDAAPFRDGVGPLLPHVLRLPRDDGPAAAELIARHRPAAVFAEPVQGEGGVHPLTAQFVSTLARACVDAGSLLVFDEIQCGLGRCGSLWAHQDLGVTPDVLLVGKTLGGGVMPVSALIAQERVYRPYDRDPLLHTSTFGGNPLAAAAVHATVQVLGEHDVPARARRVGWSLRAILDRLVRTWPTLFSSVTGSGALLGLHATRPDVSAEMIRAALAEGLLLTPCLTTPSVLRLTPSAFLEPLELDQVERALLAAATTTATELQPSPTGGTQCPP